MIIWFGLFLIIVTASLILAWRSMVDFRESPAHLLVSYGLFLVRDPANLNQETFQDLLQRAAQENLIISFENLFKGGKEALVIYGPISLLKSLDSKLGLVELEEYTSKDLFQKAIKTGQVAAWETGIKKSGLKGTLDIWTNLPTLEASEQFWWQISLKKAKLTTKEVLFQVSIKDVVWATDPGRTAQLSNQLSRLGNQSGLVVIPQAYPLAQLIKFYQDRVLPESTLKNTPTFLLNSRQIAQLLKISSS